MLLAVPLNASDTTSITSALSNWEEAVLAVKEQKLHQEHRELTFT